MRKHPLKSWLTVPLLSVFIFSLGGCVVTQEAEQAEVAIPVFPPPPDEPRFYYERSIYSSADVMPGESSTDRFMRLATGEQRQGEGFTKPFGVAAHKGRVYVSDSVAKVVLVFDFPKRKFSMIGEGGDGGLRSPLGVDVDDDGNLYVVDSSLKQVMIYANNGEFLRSIGGPSEFKRPSGVAVDPARKRIYVVDLGGVTEKEEHQVRVYDIDTGNHLFNVGKRGTKLGEFNLPVDVAVSPDGSFYVVDGGNFRVQKFRQDGTAEMIIGEIGRQGGQFSRPKAIATDKDGNIYVVDTAFGNFQIFSPQGQLLLAVGGRSEKDAPAKYMLPAGIAVDEDGRVYMTDQYFAKVEVYRPASLSEDDGYMGKKMLQPQK